MARSSSAFGFEHRLERYTGRAPRHGWRARSGWASSWPVRTMIWSPVASPDPAPSVRLIAGAAGEVKAAGVVPATLPSSSSASRAVRRLRSSCTRSICLVRSGNSITDNNAFDVSDMRALSVGVCRPLPLWSLPHSAVRTSSSTMTATWCSTSPLPSRAAGARMVELFDRHPRLRTREDVVEAIHANDRHSLAVFQPMLTRLRLKVRLGRGRASSPALPRRVVGHRPDRGQHQPRPRPERLGVTATLVRDNAPVASVVHLPLTGETYTAVRGGGAFHDGAPSPPRARWRSTAP